MRHGVLGRMGSGVAALMLVSTMAQAQTLTADRAVQLALEKNSQVISARAGVLDARAGLYSAYSRMLPSVSASLSRDGSRQEGREGSELFGTVVTPSARSDQESYSTNKGISATWNVLDLSALQSVSGARTNVRASRLNERSTRQLIAYDTRSQFYSVVRSIKLAEVASSALRLARDDERRVRALFEVGSVSRSDLLKAQVRSAQSQLDSLNAAQSVVSQRSLLAQIVGVPEAQLGDVDTTLAVSPIDVDPASLRTEALAARPDLKAADAELSSARASLRAANLSRLPFISTRGSLGFDSQSSFSSQTFGTFEIDPPGGVFVTDPVTSGRSSTDRSWSASIGVTLPIFTGMATEARIASAQASLRRAQDFRDALYRNLDAEVDLAVIQYEAALSQSETARQAVASAEENLKLTQQKYNVGSATILDLIDAQVQLQRAQSDAVSALAAIRVAEAQLNRIRGRE